MRTEINRTHTFCSIKVLHACCTGLDCIYVRGSCASCKGKYLKGFPRTHPYRRPTQSRSKLKGFQLHLKMAHFAVITTHFLCMNCHNQNANHEQRWSPYFLKFSEDPTRSLIIYNPVTTNIAFKIWYFCYEANVIFSLVNLIDLISDETTMTISDT